MDIRFSIFEEPDMRSKTLFLSFLVIIFTASVTAAAVTDNSRHLIVPAGETYTLHGSHSYSNSVKIHGNLKVSDYNGVESTGTVKLSAPVITVSGVIDANRSGYIGNPRQPSHSGEGTGEEPAAGAGYGGKGGNSYWGLGYLAEGGSPYGTPNTPNIRMGSAGAGLVMDSRIYPGGSGGGAVTLIADRLEFTGLIAADGGDGFDEMEQLPEPSGTSGAGSGGGIMLSANHCSLHGKLSVQGGDGTTGTDGVTYLYSGGGSGGRIKIFHGQIAISGLEILIDGGTGGGDKAQPGEDGTCSIQVLLDGDFNYDGIVNFRDFSRMAENWLVRDLIE